MDSPLHHPFNEPGLVYAMDTISGQNRATLTLKEIKNMFKLFYLDLVNISSEISLSILMDNKEPPRLNMITVRIYHQLFIRKLK